MITMDVKAISWVGDMYQKFEAMCMEVEETMYQDSVKYVENQVKNVGGCVKKFYSDAIQDLLPLSSDDAFKPETPGLYLVHYSDSGIYDKSEVDVRKEPVKVTSEKLGRDSYLASQLDENVDDGLSSGSCNLSKLSELPSQQSSGVKCLGLHVKQSGTEDLSLCNDNKSEEQFLPSELSVLKATSQEGGFWTVSGPGNVDSQVAILSKDRDFRAGEGKICHEIDKMNESEPSTSVISSSSEATTWDQSGSDEDISRKQDGMSCELVENEIESDDDDKEALQVSKHLSKTKLDESCVLVDKYEHFSVSHLEVKRRSYKKKIRDVFYLRSWSRSKNQKQLDVFQEEMDSSNQGSRKITVWDSALESGNTNLQSNSLESGWEIL